MFIYNINVIFYTNRLSFIINCFYESVVYAFPCG